MSTRLTDAPPGNYRSLSVGGSHSCAIEESGEIACWGRYRRWLDRRRSPGTYRAVSADFGHTCALRESGEIDCWGNNYRGETDAPPGRYRSVSTASSNTCALRESGEIACWGRYREEAPAGKYRSLSAGSYHACAIRESGEIDCWGDLEAYWECNTIACVDYLYDDGDIDHGQTAAPSGRYRSVSVGAFHTCAIRESGEIDCWGGNRYGETGRAVRQVPAAADAWPLCLRRYGNRARSTAGESAWVAYPSPAGRSPTV